MSCSSTFARHPVLLLCLRACKRISSRNSRALRLLLLMHAPHI